jgi:hypothetical protein
MEQELTPADEKAGAATRPPEELSPNRTKGFSDMLVDNIPGGLGATTSAPGGEKSNETPPPPRTEIGTHAVHVSFFADQRAFKIFAAATTLPELAELIGGKTAAEKARLPWLKLAKFGDRRSAGRSLRNNANVAAISGIEVEHDAGSMTFAAAIEAMRHANIRCLAYTSPSFIPNEKEKWRILLPLSTEHPPETRAELVARANGLLGGVIANESFVLSQSFYFGHVGEAVHREVVLDGDFIDQRPDLDAGAIGKREGDGPGKGHHHHGQAVAPGRTDDEILGLVQQSRELNRFGERQWHNNMLKATASMVGKGWTDAEIYEATAPFCDDGWGDPDIETMVNGARAKYEVPDPAEELSTRLGDEVLKLLREPKADDGAEAGAEAGASSAGAKASASSAEAAWDPWRETPAPRLDHALLPRVVREAAAISAQASGADIDAFAVAYLVGLASCCDTRLRITPKQHATDWSGELKREEAARAAMRAAIADTAGKRGGTDSPR